ncbi:MAG: HAMP domain-containing histidine kinase [Muribaculaceae bacterium]|nr:HAMP domain-containing histidine kinase [Muribaculaceae bacterium]
MIVASAAILCAAILFIVWGFRHQCLLRDRAVLMRDAMRHRDFSFKLPVKGLLFGERALQQALNEMGHDIERLVARNEVESWQRLTRVLTHEIMNATAPIRSISQAYLELPGISETPFEEGLKAIYDTSTGLSVFVDNYRKLTLLQEPVMSDIDFAAFCGSLRALFPELEWEVYTSGVPVIRADEDMLRQVFINLVKNAKEADARSMCIRCEESSILISNDGHVIPDEVAREIFIPFFTTKSGGNGIGLSLSRQILMSQGYLLRLAERPERNYNVTFILER